MQASRADCMGAQGNFLGAFNDTYVSYYDTPPDQDGDGAWPERPSCSHDPQNGYSSCNIIDPELL
jgi:hypothetical protein